MRTIGPRMLAHLAAELAGARRRARTGDALLDALSVAAFTVAATVMLLTATGTWMFYDRAEHPHGIIAAAAAEAPHQSMWAHGYILLAGFACVLLLVPVIGLAVAATMLGARSRQRRLAVLRLVGLTRALVAWLGFVEVLAQAVAGILLAGGIALALRPAFTGLSFQAMPVTYEDLDAPWWLYPAVAAAVLAVTAIASAIGLLRVQVSPLGVARRQFPTALRWWRVGAVAALIAIAAVTRAGLGNRGAGTGMLIAIIVMAACFMLGVDVLMPFLLQLASRRIARSRSVTVSWAARLVASAPDATWRRVGPLSLMVLLATFFAQIPTGAGAVAGATAYERVRAATLPDIRTGMFLALGFAFVIAAVSTLVNRASAEFEGAGRTRAMLRMGVSDLRLRAVAYTESLGPLAGSVALALLFGWLLGMLLGANPSMTNTAAMANGFTLVVVVVAVGFALMAAALALTRPIHRRIAAQVAGA